MTTISGTITESHNATDWLVRTYRADTGALLAETAVDTTSSGSYSASCGSYAGAVFATCHPKLGTRWAAATDTLLNSYCFPTDLSAKPYFYKATTAPAGDSNFSSVKLLLHCDGTDNSTTFTDSSSSALTVTANGNVHIHTGEKKFGTASAAFDGSGDYLSVPSIPFSTGDFTIECWVNFASASGAYGVFDRRSSLNARGLSLYINNGVATLNAGDSDQAAWEVTLTSSTLSTNTWIHLAATRASNVYRLFVDGTKVGEATWTGTVADDGSTLLIGRIYSTYDYSGYIDEFRITVGVARYTANFTPTTAAFPDQAGALTGSSEPTWPTTTGNTVADGDVTWTCMGPLVQPITQGPLISA